MNTVLEARVAGVAQEPSTLTADDGASNVGNSPKSCNQSNDRATMH